MPAFENNTRRSITTKCHWTLLHVLSAHQTACMLHGPGVPAVGGAERGGRSRRPIELPGTSTLYPVQLQVQDVCRRTMMSMLRDHDFQIRVAPLPVAGFFLIFLFFFFEMDRPVLLQEPSSGSRNGVRWSRSAWSRLNRGSQCPLLTDYIHAGQQEGPWKTSRCRLSAVCAGPWTPSTPDCCSGSEEICVVHKECKQYIYPFGGPTRCTP